MGVLKTATAHKATVICGDCQFPRVGTNIPSIYRFVRMIKLAEISPQWEQVGLGKIDRSTLLDLLNLQIGRHLERGRGGNYRSPRDLLDIVHGMRHKISTDPRDKVFSLLRVAVTYGMDEFNVNCSMTVEETYFHHRNVINLG